MAILEVAAVVVAHLPTPRILDCLASIHNQVSELIVVDNTPKPTLGVLGLGPELISSTTVIHNDQNLGIAAGLNQGFELARSKGYKHAIALDQDSRAEDGMVRSLVGHLNQSRHAANLAIVAPSIVDPAGETHSRYLQARWRMLFKQSRCAEGVVLRATIVVSSGALFDLAVHKRLGGFREDFFIDYVDTEYCLRAMMHGYGTDVVCNARLLHKIGNAREIAFGPLRFHPTFHQPGRWYYIGRNRVPTHRMYGLMFPHWMLFDLAYAVWWTVRMLLFERGRREKLTALLSGTVDGLRNHLGPSP